MSYISLVTSTMFELILLKEKNEVSKLMKFIMFIPLIEKLMNISEPIHSLLWILPDTLWNSYNKIISIVHTLKMIIVTRDISDMITNR